MLSLLGHIFMSSMLPIFMLVCTGIFLDKKFKMDLYTLSKLNFYVFLPTFIFKSLYEAPFTLKSLEIIVCAIIVLMLNYATGFLGAKLAGFDAAKNAATRNVVMFNNCGNMGVALAVFVFSNIPYVVDGTTPYLATAMVSVLSIMLIQTITSNTFGFYQAAAGRMSTRAALSTVFHMPMIYTVPAALLLKLAPFDLHSFFFYKPIGIFANCFVGIALIALGVQINRTPLNFFHKDVMLATFLRLILSPIIALVTTLIIIHLYGPMDTISAQALVITYSVPSAVNMALIAIEMKNNPEYTTQVVMSTTILSALTMPIFILLAYYTFPL